jgi:hypothetical protein
MKFKKIVGFGDSWMWGDELLDPTLMSHPHAHPVLMENTPYREGNCFLGQLGRHYGVPTQNFGIAGGSLQSSIWTYLWWLENETLDPQDCLILVALTDPNRQTFYNPNHVSYANDPPWNRFVHSAWVHSGNTANGDDWHDFVKCYTVISDCSSLHQLNFKQAVLFFSGQRTRTAGVLQFNSVNHYVQMEDPTLIWPNQSMSHMIGALPNPKQYLAVHGHPNINGHEWLCDHLITEIDHVILA